MALSNARKGECLVLVEKLLWSSFPIVVLISLSTILPLVSAGLTMLIASFFFAVVMTLTGRWYELKNRLALKPLLLATLLNGVIFFPVLFWGQSKTSAGNAAIVLQMEIFFSVVLLRLFNKEHLEPLTVLGAACMFVGAIVVLLPGFKQFRLGDIIILTATMIPPVGNWFLKQARQHISSPSIMFVRSGIGGGVALLLALCLQQAPSYADIASALPYLLFNGLVLMGLTKIFWVEAIALIPIGKATALSALSPFFTLVYAYYFLGEVPTVFQLAGLLPITAGLFLLVRGGGKG